MKKNKNVYDGAEMVPENVENTHKKGKSLTGRIFRWMCLAVGGSLMLVCIINILVIAYVQSFGCTRLSCPCRACPHKT